MSWIKLSRNILHWEHYKDKNARILFIHLLLSVNYEEWSLKGETMNAGSSVFSLKTLAIETGLSVQNIRSSLQKLTSSGELKSSKIGRKILVEISLWKRYQTGQVTRNQHESNTKATRLKTSGELGTKGLEGNGMAQVTRNQHESNTKATRSYIYIEEGRRKKEEKTKGKSESKKPKLNYDKWVHKPSPQILADWLAIRKANKHPLTQTTLDMFARQLALAEKNGYSVDECLELCIEKGWRGFKADWIKTLDKSISRTHTGRMTKQEMLEALDEADRKK